MYGASDVHVENVPDARLRKSTDALAVVIHAALRNAETRALRKQFLIQRIPGS